MGVKASSIADILHKYEAGLAGGLVNQEIEKDGADERTRTFTYCYART